MLKRLINYNKQYRHAAMWMDTFKAREEKKRLLNEGMSQITTTDNDAKQKEVNVFAQPLVIFNRAELA